MCVTPNILLKQNIPRLPAGACLPSERKEEKCGKLLQKETLNSNFKIIAKQYGGVYDRKK